MERLVDFKRSYQRSTDALRAIMRKFCPEMDEEDIAYCQSKGIVMEAYSPVAHGEALKNPVIAAMAEKYHVTIPQLCIRYDLQLDMITLPKTANPAHMKSNSEVDFTITAEDMETLKHVARISRFFGGGLFM